MVDFETNAGLLSNMGVSVIAASVDSAEDTETLKAGLRIGFIKLVSGLDGAEVAAAVGANLQTGDRTFLQATGFLVDPAGQVNTSLYSSGPIGRFTANDVMKKVGFEIKRAQSA